MINDVYNLSFVLHAYDVSKLIFPQYYLQCSEICCKLNYTIKSVNEKPIWI